MSDQRTNRPEPDPAWTPPGLPEQDVRMGLTRNTVEGAWLELASNLSEPPLMPVEPLVVGRADGRLALSQRIGKPQHRNIEPALVGRERLDVPAHEPAQGALER